MRIRRNTEVEWKIKKERWHSSKQGLDGDPKSRYPLRGNEYCTHTNNNLRVFWVTRNSITETLVLYTEDAVNRIRLVRGSLP